MFEAYQIMSRTKDLERILHIFEEKIGKNTRPRLGELLWLSSQTS